MEGNTKTAGNLNVWMTTFGRQKKFLPLLLDIWLVSPQEKGGQVIPIEDVVKRRSKTILHIDNSLGTTTISMEIIRTRLAHMKKTRRGILY